MSTNRIGITEKVKKIRLRSVTLRMNLNLTRLEFTTLSQTFSSSRSCFCSCFGSLYNANSPFESRDPKSQVEIFARLTKRDFLCFSFYRTNYTRIQKSDWALTKKFIRRSTNRCKMAIKSFHMLTLINVNILYGNTFEIFSYQT